MNRSQRNTRFFKLVHAVAVFACMLVVSQVKAEVSQYDRQIIASVLVLEAACQGEEGMRAVLNVINNRAKGDPEGAVAQVARRKAFTCINAITSQANPDYSPAISRAMNDRTWDLAMFLVDAYCAGQLGADNTDGSTHYCIDPPQSWREQMAFTKRIGAHTFFREG